MAGELENLYQLFTHLNIAPFKALQKLQPGALKEVIAQFLIRCPVYRYYGNSLPLNQQEAKAVTGILQEIIQTKPELTAAANLISKVLTRPVRNEQQRAAALRFYQRCMQFSGPLMAKGVEDTLMYTYDRFIGHNEVGDSPDEFGLKIGQFHEYMVERQTHQHMSVNATSTHDTKRGEDVRAKLNVLTDIPEEWISMVNNWQHLHKKFKKNGIPDANDEYLIYQTLAGAVSLPGEEQDDLGERLHTYLIKALREAKTHTQWAEPDNKYEKATTDFTEQLLKPQGDFWESLHKLQSRIADYFVLNSLAQLLLKFTCPGMPDIYQGCELWDFSLVDPDNRRPVDFEVRKQKLKEVREYSLNELWDKRHDGSLKLWLTYKLLHERQANVELFNLGNYIPLPVKGKYQDKLIAFARVHLREWLVVLIPLHLAGISESPFPDLIGMIRRYFYLTMHLWNGREYCCRKNLFLIDMSRFKNC